MPCVTFPVYQMTFCSWFLPLLLLLNYYVVFFLAPVEHLGRFYVENLGKYLWLYTRSNVIGLTYRAFMTLSMPIHIHRISATQVLYCFLLFFWKESSLLAVCRSIYIYIVWYLQSWVYYLTVLFKRSLWGYLCTLNYISIETKTTTFLHIMMIEMAFLYGIISACGVWFLHPE